MDFQREVERTVSGFKYPTNSEQRNYLASLLIRR